MILTSFLFTIKPDITVGDDGFYMDYMREDFKLRNSGKILCIASLLGLLVLSGCGRKSEPAAGIGADGAAVEAEGTASVGADEGRADEEIHIYSDTRAGATAGDETAPAANGGAASSRTNPLTWNWTAGGRYGLCPANRRIPLTHPIFTS